MNFEKQKQDIIKCAEVAYGYIDDEEYDDAQGLITSILDLVKQLKPDYPTCSKCEYSEKVYKLVSKNDGGFCRRLAGFECKKVQHLKETRHDSATLLPLKNFGCNQHSGLESKDETN